MITPGQARHIIRQYTKTLAPARLSLEAAAGFVLAENIYATIDIPAFPQSSVDGYAISFAHWQAEKKLTLNGNIPAGHADHFQLQSGEAAQIFTGAAVPDGADTVVMQEKINLSGDQLLIGDDKLQAGSNVRSKGSEIKAGSLALAEDSYLSPPAIGFLAGIGIHEVLVYPDPVISIIVTGDELQQPGKPLVHGQVYESNSIALKSALKQLYFKDITVYQVNDELEKLTAVLATALEKSDLVLLTGGVSVGEYDFVVKAAEACGVEMLFHKVKQRPGKPLYFGKKERKPVFGLPGNPSSVLTCFYEYVIPALEKLNKRIPSLASLEVPLLKPFSKKTDLTHFLKGLYDGKGVLPFDAQESYRMSSFARANCLIQIDENSMDIKEGEMVQIHLLPV